jgi:hypothetical protein
MCQKHNMLGSRGFSVGGCMTCIDILLPLLSSSDMPKEHIIDDAIKAERIATTKAKCKR